MVRHGAAINRNYKTVFPAILVLYSSGLSNHLSIRPSVHDTLTDQLSFQSVLFRPNLDLRPGPPYYRLVRKMM